MSHHLHGNLLLSLATGRWVDLVRDFIAEFIAPQPVVLVGNSVGSLVVLTVGALTCMLLCRGFWLVHLASRCQQMVVSC